MTATYTVRRAVVDAWRQLRRATFPGKRQGQRDPEEARAAVSTLGR